MALQPDPAQHDDDPMLRRAAEGDESAWREMVARYEPRLRRMIQLRLDRRIQGRADEGDVLQEAFLEVHRKLPEYTCDPKLPPYLWVRRLAGLKLAELHRRHLGTRSRDADCELKLDRCGLPEVDTSSMIAHLLGSFTSPSKAAAKIELQLQVQSALQELEPVDREIIALKHYEQLSTAEVAEVLGLSKAGAGHRYVKAIKSLRDKLTTIPGFIGF